MTRQLDLEPDEFRPLLSKPLGRRRPLLWAMALWVVLAINSVWLAWSFGGLWTMGPLLWGVFIGVTATGLWPGFWFRDVPAPSHAPTEPENETGSAVFSPGGIWRLFLGAVVLAIVVVFAMWSRGQL